MLGALQQTMTRNTGAVKTVAIALVLLGWLYTMYKYHETSEKLQNSRQLGERVRKEQEKLSSKLQDTLTEAEDHRQNFEREKKEYDNRLKSLQQQHSMLKAQHQDLEAELTKVQREKDKEAEDQKSQDLQRTQEYERFKQEKELEISNLKDEVANLRREKGNFEEQIQRLNGQLQNSQQQFQAQLQESQQRVIQLQQAVQQNQLAHQQQMANQFNQQQNQAVGQQNVPNPALGQQFDSRYQGAGGNQVIQNQNANQFGQNLPPNNQHKDVDLRFLDKQSLDKKQQQQPVVNQQNGVDTITMNAEDKAKLMEHNQQQHQVQPPKMNDKDENLPEHEKVEESAGSPINKTAIEQRKDIEEHPNIRPPEVLDAEEIKYGQHRKEEKTADSKLVKPKLDDPVLQVAPPNDSVGEKRRNLVDGFNIQPPKGDSGKDEGDSQKQQTLQPPRVV